MSNKETRHTDDELELHEIWETLCDNKLTETQRHKLRSELQKSSLQRQLYIRYLSLHFWLRLRYSRYKDNLHSSELSELVNELQSEDVAKNFARKQKFIFAIAAALLLMTLPIAIWKSNTQTSAAKNEEAYGRYAAMLTSTHKCAWANPQDARLIGDTIREGERIRLNSGLIELLFDSGAKVVLKGPADFQITGSDSCNLLHGEFVAKVDNLATGFTANTPQAKIVDIGTEFGVRSLNPKDFRLQVFQGEIRVFDNSVLKTTSNKLLGSITEGHAAIVEAIDSGAISMKVTESEPTEAEFVRSMPEESEQVDLSKSPLVAIDGFGRGYAGNKLANMNSGFGWSSPWQDKTPELASTDTILFSDQVTLESQGTAAIHRKLPQAIGPDETIYASARFQIDGPDQICTAWILLFEQANKIGAGETDLMAFGLSDGRFSARLAPRDGDLAVSPNSKRLGDFGNYQTGATHQFVARLEFNADGDKERLAFWIDPETDSDTSLPAPDHVVVYDTGRTQVDMVAIRFWEMDNGTKPYIDDLKIGKTWSSVIE